MAARTLPRTGDELKAYEARAMSEKDLQAAVIRRAKALGWRVHAERAARTKDGWATPIQGHPGWPDLVLLKPPRLIVAELKSQIGRATDDQVTWLLALNGVAGCETYVWRPENLGEIERVLMGGQ